MVQFSTYADTHKPIYERTVEGFSLGFLDGFGFDRYNLLSKVTNTGSDKMLQRFSQLPAAGEGSVLGRDAAPGLRCHVGLQVWWSLFIHPFIIGAVTFKVSGTPGHISSGPDSHICIVLLAPKRHRNVGF